MTSAPGTQAAHAGFETWQKLAEQTAGVLTRTLEKPWPKTTPACERRARAPGTASLARRCALDFIDTETRERLPRANDVHYADDATQGRPLCGRKTSSPHEKPATTRSE